MLTILMCLEEVYILQREMQKIGTGYKVIGLEVTADKTKYMVMS
jgi:hypothetical protein